MFLWLGAIFAPLSIVLPTWIMQELSQCGQPCHVFSSYDSANSHEFARLVLVTKVIMVVCPFCGNELWIEKALSEVWMIIVRMYGGLGNQLFQYAAGRSLSLKIGLPLSLDLRHYNRRREHGFALTPYGLDTTSLPDRDLPPLPRKQPIASALYRLMGRQPRRYHEAHLGFDPAMADISGPAWIDGYFQTERYFSDFADTIRSDLTPKTSPDPVNAKWLEEIQNEPRAVSLHVRRGDYVRNERFAAFHGSCTPTYYERALEHIRGEISAEPIIYAFSDDPEWVRENLNLNAEVKVVGHNDASRNFEDIRLMSACRHHIIANSSFSWWGAWLNPRTEKRVVAPARWFAAPQTVNPDIWAEGWTRIEG